MRFFLFYLISSVVCWAHTIPNLEVNAEFYADETYTLSINFDPRLFLSKKPTELPPLQAEWWLKQTAQQRVATMKQAVEYLHAALVLVWSEKPGQAPVYDITAIDSATTQPVTAQTQEVHLLAHLRDKLSAEQKHFQLQLNAAANAALVLFQRLGEKEEKRPQVLFSGETSRPFLLRKAVDSVLEHSAEK
jgi:hypothetical protein